MPPLVSIVTPSFNQAQFLEQAICSVLEQDYTEIEYLVADGGSTDGSRQIIEKFSPRLTWWVSEPDQGQGDAIRKGFSHARGSYLAWINSDDYYLNGMISEAVQALEANPQWGFVYADVLAVDEHDRRINLLRYEPYTLADLMQFKIIGQPAVVMRRSIYEQAGGISADYHYMLDHHLWLRMAALAPFGYLPRTLAAARFHQAAKNVAMSAAFSREAQQITEWTEREEPFKTNLFSIRPLVWGGAYRFGARYLSEGRQYREALQMYAKAWQQNPAVVIKDWKRVGVTLLGRLGLWK